MRKKLSLLLLLALLLFPLSAIADDRDDMNYPIEDLYSYAHNRIEISLIERLDIHHYLFDESNLPKFVCNGKEIRLAWGVAVIGGGQVDSAAGGCDSCTSNLTFSWHAEDLDVEEDTPCGCTVADTKSGTLNSDAAISGTQYHDGDESLSIPTNYDFITFDNNNGATLVVDDDVGTVELYIYVTTWFNSSRIFSSIVTADQDALELFLYSDDEIYLKYEGQNAGPEYALTNDANMSLNTWYRITAKWTTSDVDPNLWVQVCDTNGANCSTADISNVNLMTFTSNPTEFKVGSVKEGYAAVYFIDQVKIWDSWQ